MSGYLVRLVRKNDDGEPDLIVATGCPDEDALESLFASLLSHGPERLVPGDVLLIDALEDKVDAGEAADQVWRMAETSEVPAEEETGQDCGE